MKKTLLSVAFLFATFVGANAQQLVWTQDMIPDTASGVTLGDANGYNIFPGYLEGTLTAVEITATKVSGTSPAGELAIYVTPTGAFTLGGALYAGGSSNTAVQAVEWQQWPNNDGTTISGIITLATPITFTSSTFVRLVNLYQQTPGTQAVWDNVTVTLYGVTESVPYCRANTTNCQWDSITNVTFAGINNTSACTVGNSDYTSEVATVTQGETAVSLSVSANFDDGDGYLYAFIDWNQDGDLTGANEVYQLGAALETGVYTLNVDVPADAVVGQTRMRVMGVWSSTNIVIDPCTSYQYGEVENYTVNVQQSASTGDFISSAFSVYPNPATDVINISNSVDAIENVTITDMNGRVVKQAVNQEQINISDLSQGVYILNATSNGKSFTQKVVKQ